MDKVRDAFDSWAITYDTYLDTSPYYQELIDALVGGSSIRSGMNVLDIGIGTGRISQMILDKIDCRISGIDLSPSMLGEARRNLKKYGDNCRFYEMDVSALDFEDNTFDAAFAAFALHHIPDKKKIDCLKRVRRVLKPNGLLNIAEVVVDVEGNAENPERLKHILERWGYAALVALQHGGSENVVVELDAIKNIYLRNGEYLIPAHKWQKMMEDAGFQNIQTIQINTQLGHYIFRGGSGA